jgi:FHS family glucose/mannose:H+ symporter-like MFS transporter
MYSKHLVFAAACAGMLLFGIVMLSLGSLLPALCAKFSLDTVSAGTLATLLPFGILAGSLLFGPVVDRFGYKTLLAVCTVLVALSMEGVARASAVVLLQACIFVIGFGGGVLNGATNALAADISEEGRGARLSLLGVFFGIGALGMPALLGLLSSYFRQETILQGMGAFVLAVALFYFSIRFPVPKQAQGFPLAKGLSLITDTTLLLFAFILFFESAMEGMLNTWTTTFLQHAVAATAERALFALSCLVGSLTAARLLLSRLLRFMSMWTALFAGVALLAAGGILLATARTYEVAIPALVLAGMGCAPVFPVILGAVADRFAALSGTAFSVALAIGLIGNMTLNYLVGIAANSYGIEYFPLMVLASLCLMALLIIATKTRLSRAPTL